MILKLKVERLDIFWKIGPGCRITDMSDTGSPFQVVSNSGRQNIGNETRALKFLEVRAVIGGNSGAFLPPVLERVQGIVELD